MRDWTHGKSGGVEPDKMVPHRPDRILVISEAMTGSLPPGFLTTPLFFYMDDDRAVYLVEYNQTNQIFTNPQNQRTEDYITERFG